MELHRSIIVAVVLLGLSGCDNGGAAATACSKDTDCKGERVCVHGACEEPGAVKTSPAKPAQDPTAATPAPASPPADRAVTTPEQQSYPMASIKTIPDGCSQAHAVLATAPDSVGSAYEWQWSRQAMLANQQFKTTASYPVAHGEVSFDVYHADAKLNNAWVLVGNCADGATCNHLAAMYKGVVKSSRPEPICGDVPASWGRSQKTIDLLAGGPRNNLPRASDTIAQCARIAACTLATTPSTTEDIGIACQKSPSSFKRECAARYPCAEVMACIGQ